MEKDAEIETEPAHLVTYGQVTAGLARPLCAILIALCNQGRAVNILMKLSGTIEFQLGGA